MPQVTYITLNFPCFLCLRHYEEKIEMTRARNKVEKIQEKGHLLIPVYLILMYMYTELITKIK